MNIDKVGFGNELVMPYLLQERGPRQHFFAPLHHVFEQHEFTRTEINLSPVTPGGSVDEVEFERSHAQRRLCACNRRRSFSRSHVDRSETPLRPSPASER